MSVKTADVTVAATATQLSASGEACEAVAVWALEANVGIVYIGGSDVTTATGIPIEKKLSASFNVRDVGELYCIGTANDHIRILIYR